MLIMENSEEVLQILERYAKLKPKDIPKELEDYLCYVAKTGDTVYRWTHVKHLFREKLIRVIKDFHESTPSIEDLPQYPNVDPFNYESLKSALLERLELFSAAPFTVQRLCELLTDPRKQYSRIDKYMRALEKNILVVSTIEPGRKPADSENGDSLDSVVNGDLSLDVNVEVDMEGEHLFNIETANTSTDAKTRTTDSSNESDATNSRLENGDEEKKVDAANERLDVDVLSSSDSDSNKDKSEHETSQPNTEEEPEKEDTSTEKETSEEKSNERLAEETKIEDKSQEEKDTNLTEDSKDSTHTTLSEKDKIESPESKAEDKQSESNEHGIETESWKTTTTSSESECPLPTDEEKKVTESEDSVVAAREEQEVEDAAHSKTDEPIPSETPVEEESHEFDIAVSEKPVEETLLDEDPEIKAKKVQEQMAIEEMSAPLPEEQTCNDALLQPMADTTTPPAVIPDQPMDDNLENTPPIPASSCLNEVVMQSETEMATDSDNVKAEAAVMDIDDTSQEEAMDQ